MLALFLPILTFLTLAFPAALNKLMSTRLTSPATIQHLLTVLDTALLTLASTEIRPDGLWCSLDRRWLKLFRNKDSDAVRAIQNTLSCCGLWRNADRAWPFPDHNHDARSCLVDYGRETSCGERWTNQARFVLGVWIAIGAYNLLARVCCAPS